MADLLDQAFERKAAALEASRGVRVVLSLQRLHSLRGKAMYVSVTAGTSAFRYRTEIQHFQNDSREGKILNCPDVVVPLAESRNILIQVKEYKPQTPESDHKIIHQKIVAASDGVFDTGAVEGMVCTVVAQTWAEHLHRELRSYRSATQSLHKMLNAHREQRRAVLAALGISSATGRLTP